MISSELRQELVAYLKCETQFGSEESLKEIPVSGGCINDCYKWSTDSSQYFIKINSESDFPGMFEKEKKGLEILNRAKAIKIPEVVGTLCSNNKTVLVLEFIDSASMKIFFWEDFGNKLAQLHQNTQSEFGLDHDNYIGSLYQSNSLSGSWNEFFINERILPQVKMALDSKMISSGEVRVFELLFKKLYDIFPEEPPSLLHGDLWSGNFMVDNKGEASLVDPAVYYGHREMEISFTSLFGGFDSSFYNAYNNTFPLKNGFESRKDIYNLYPLLVHLNLFGLSYLSQINFILNPFRG